MTCTKSIIECLRVKGVNPIAFASDEYSSSEKAPEALNYESNSHFYTKTNSMQQWAVDFTQQVTVEKYNIKSSNGCN